MSRSNPLRAERETRRTLARAWHQAWTFGARCWQTSARTARLAIGIPDYDNYLTHVRRHHPEREAMSRDAFFIERMNARYGKGRSRCC
jgi:uncharacterized short protein YbdD (DUF466 family)